MSLANTDPERFENAQVDFPQKTVGKLIMPDRAIPKAEVPTIAKHLSDSLREFTDSLTAYVMLKQAEQIIKSAQEQTLDFALVKMNGKELSVFGATVKTRALVEYEYDDPKLRELEAQMEEIKVRIDTRRKLLRLADGKMADAETGEVLNPAKKVRDGQTLTVTFK